MTVCQLAVTATAFAQVTPGVGTESVFITEVEVTGNQRIESDTVRAYMTVNRGEAYDEEAVDKSLKTLFSTGLFADVTITLEDTKLVVDVIENPIINRMAFEGNQDLNDEELSPEVQLRPRVVFTRARVQADVQRIVDLYRNSGLFAATIEPKVVQLPQNRVDLIFEIDEGDATGISRISFLGNETYEDQELRRVVATKESRWYKFFGSDDSYDPDRLAFDQELLRRHYYSRGYADFRVISAVAELTKDRKGFFVTITLEEGEKYQIGEVGVKSEIADLSTEKLESLILTPSGDIYNADKVDETIEGMTFEAGRLGYAFLDIEPIMERVEQDGIDIINMTYHVIEAPRVYVERINVFGNVRTLDTVLRREFRLVEGDAFNSRKLERTRQRLRGLGFFEAVEVEQRPGSQDDRTIIDVAVKERSTGELSVGAGFSTQDSALAEISISERNLLGRGQALRASIRAGGRAQQLNVGFTEPYFTGRPIATGADLFMTKNNFQRQSGFDQKSQGFSLRAGFPITEYLRTSFRYKLRKTEITDVHFLASRFIQEQAGTETESSFGYSFSYDRRDDPVNPRRGYIANFSQDVAGLGGTLHFIRTTYKYNFYHPIWEKYDIIGKIGFNEGFIHGFGEDIKVSNRFFIGGDTFRGFEAGGVGPRDTLTDDALGGNAYYVIDAQAQFPLGLPDELAIQGRAFAFFGALTEADTTTPLGGGIFGDLREFFRDSGKPRLSVGVGISWASPFGPIEVDLSKAIMKEKFDQDETFSFNVGTRF
jgi:outer membrane protein insertion porin family